MSKFVCRTIDNFDPDNEFLDGSTTRKKCHPRNPFQLIGDQVNSPVVDKSNATEVPDTVKLHSIRVRHPAN